MNRRLYRSRTDTILAGVASGLAKYLGTDPALVRIAWAILVPLTGGVALVAYVVAWIVMQEEPASVGPLAATAPATDPAAEPVTDPVTGAPDETSSWAPPAASAQSSGRDAGVWVGVGLVLIGLWFLLREYLPDFDWGLIWPLVVVAIGVLILWTSMRRRAG